MQDSRLAPGGHIPQHDAPHPGRSAPPASTPLRGDTISSDAGARPRIRPTAEQPTRGATTTDDGPGPLWPCRTRHAPPHKTAAVPAACAQSIAASRPNFSTKFANHVRSARSRTRGRNECAAPAQSQAKRWPMREAKFPFVEAASRPSKLRVSKSDKFQKYRIHPNRTHVKFEPI